MKSKLLEDLGRKNWLPGKEDSRYDEWKKTEEETGVYSPEGWDLDSVFIDWVYCHVYVFKEEGGRIVNLEYHTFEFEGKIITQLEGIDLLLDICKDLFKLDDLDPIYDQQLTRLCALWGTLLPAMWW